ncbi:hypothetical protein FQZ97_690100 [compost metagenome]
MRRDELQDELIAGQVQPGVDQAQARQVQFQPRGPRGHYGIGVSAIGIALHFPFHGGAWPSFALPGQGLIGQHVELLAHEYGQILMDAADGRAGRGRGGRARGARADGRLAAGAGSGRFGPASGWRRILGRGVLVQAGLGFFPQLGGIGPAEDQVAQVGLIEEAAGLQRVAQGLAQRAGRGAARGKRGMGGGAGGRIGFGCGVARLAGGGRGIRGERGRGGLGQGCGLGRGRLRRGRRGLPGQARGRLGGRAGGLAGGGVGAPERCAALERGRGFGILGEQGENRARGTAQRGGGRGRGVAAGDQPAGGQRKRGGGLGVDDSILAVAAGAARLYALPGIADRAVGRSGPVQAAGLADCVRPGAGDEIRVGGGHRRAEHGVQPLH